MFGAMDKDKKLQILDVIVWIGLIIISCTVGKLVMNVHDSWLGFNGPVLGIMGIGGLIWWGVRKKLLDK